MKIGFLLICGLLSFTTSAQVYNFGANEVAFKNLISNGITYIKTGDSLFDQTVLEQLEAHWLITSFTSVERYKRPEETSTALFITTKEFTKKHAIDRKNQHVLVLQPASLYVPNKEVSMEETLGYMYLNGFYDLVKETEEHRFVYMLIRALNQGISVINSKQLAGDPIILNEKIASEIRGADAPSVGNTLIINREQTRHTIVVEELDKLGIKYRLLGEEELYKTMDQKDPTHIMLYFAVNRFAEMALVRIANGETIYAKHFREDYLALDKKELKLIASFFI